MINCIKPDERSVMTYVSAYYNAFAGVQQVNKFVAVFDFILEKRMFFCFYFFSIKILLPQKSMIIILDAR
jgi:hypothetical protein